MADDKDKEPTILDAVTAAVREVSPEPSAPEETQETEETEEQETEETEEQETEETGEEGGDDDDDEGADGAGAAGEGGEGEGADGAAAGEGDDKDKDKGPQHGEPDHVNDPIPADTKQATRERITALSGRVKELAPLAQERDELLQAIESTGATPQQYAQSLQVLALYNSDKPEDRKQALSVLKGMVHELAVDLNETVEFDLLGSYPDLQAEVEEGSLTQERALELARTRERTRLSDARRAAQTETENVQRDMQQAVETGKTALNTLEAQLKARDGELYERKKAALVPMLKSIMSQVHPRLWAKTFYDTYQSMPAPAPAAATPPAGGGHTTPPRRQPLRAQQSAGGGAQPAPTNANEAVRQALGLR